MITSKKTCKMMTVFKMESKGKRRPNLYFDSVMIYIRLQIPVNAEGLNCKPLRWKNNSLNHFVIIVNILEEELELTIL